MRIKSIDHLVLTVKNLQATIQFYTDIMGMHLVDFRDKDHNTRYALSFGQQKINLHQAGKEFVPHAGRPTSGSADLCFLSDTPVEEIRLLLSQKNIEVLEGPVQRTGANGPILSIYFEDPDGNLIEVANPLYPASDPDI